MNLCHFENRMLESNFNDNIDFSFFNPSPCHYPNMCHDKCCSISNFSGQCEGVVGKRACGARERI